MEITQRDRMTGLGTIETTVFNNDRAKIIAESVDRARPYASAGRRSTYDHAVAMKQRQVIHQLGAVEAARLGLIHHDVLRLWRNLRHDVRGAVVCLGNTGRLGS